MRTLYHTPLSPYCRKTRVHLREKLLEFELTDEPVWERRDEFFRLNPAGEVPVLMDENGLVISSSYAICEYLEEGYPTEPHLFGVSVAERAEVRRLMSWFDVKFYHEVAQGILFERVFRKLMHYGAPDTETIRESRRNIVHHLDYIAHLTQERPWLAGDHLTLADITAAAHFSVVDYLGDVPWEYAPRAKEWYAVVKSRPSFRPLLADRMRGFPPPSHYDDPDF
jgi:glutathione S-transferase